MSSANGKRTNIEAGMYNIKAIHKSKIRATCNRSEME